jgi:hypothetical protein
MGRNAGSPKLNVNDLPPQEPGAHTFPLTIKTILPITGRLADRTGAKEKCAPNISVFNISVIFIREIRVIRG